jgi:hypothetical protein
VKDDLEVRDIVVQIGNRILVDVSIAHTLPGYELVVNSADHRLQRL